MSIVLNLPYSQQLTVIGGTAPYALSIQSGSLPTGLSMDITGLISGTPTVLGTSNFTVQAVDGFLGFGTRAYALEVIQAVNTIGDDLAAQNVAHYWPMDEASGSLIADNGSGSLDLTIQGPAGTLSRWWHRGPGLVVRGLPRSFGITQNKFQSGPYAAAQSGPTVIGTLTGGFGANVIVWDDNTAADQYLVSVTIANNGSLVGGIQVDTSGRVIVELVGSLGKFVRKRTSVGLIQPGESAVIFFQQKADGNGLLLYINGVPNTDEAATFGGAGVNIDSWFEDVFVGFTVTQTTVGGVNIGGSNTVFDGSEAVTISVPHMFVNEVLTDAEVLSNFNAMQTTLPSTDFYETCLDVARSVQATDLVYLGPNYVGPIADQTMGSAPVGAAQFPMRFSGFDVDDMNIDDNVVGERVESGFATKKFSYDLADNSAFFNLVGQMNWAAGDTAGTMCAVVTIRGCPNGDRKIIQTYGSGATNSFELGIVGSAIGYQMFFRAFENPTETFRVLSGIFGSGVAPDFRMLSVVQPGDGSGAIIYLDDTEVGAVPEVSTNPDVWVADYGLLGVRFGGEQASATVDNWEPGDLHKVLHVRRALSATEIARVWNSVKGTSF